LHAPQPFSFLQKVNHTQNRPEREKFQLDKTKNIVYIVTMSTWKPYPPAPDRYEVCDLGLVFSLVKGEVLRHRFDKWGYPHVRIQINKKKVNRAVHRMVLETFEGPRPAGMECRHLDGDKINNHIDNLQWGSSYDNYLDQVDHGLPPIPPFKAVLTLEQARLIRQLYRPKVVTLRYLAGLFNVSDFTIQAVVKNRTWKE
jgi:HNH endonuclease